MALSQPPSGSEWLAAHEAFPIGKAAGPITSKSRPLTPWQTTMETLGASTGQHGFLASRSGPVQDRTGQNSLKISSNLSYPRYFQKEQHFETEEEYHEGEDYFTKVNSRHALPLQISGPKSSLGATDPRTPQTTCRYRQRHSS